MALYTDIFRTDFLCRWLSIHRQGSSALLRGPACRSIISMRPLTYRLRMRSSTEAGPTKFPQEDRSSGLGSLLRLFVDIVKHVQTRFKIVDRRGRIQIS